MFEPLRVVNQRQRKAVPVIQNRVGPLRRQIAEVLRTARCNDRGEEVGSAVIDRFAERVGSLNVEAIAETTIQLPLQTVIRRRAPRLIRRDLAIESVIEIRGSEVGPVVFCVDQGSEVAGCIRCPQPLAGRVASQVEGQVVGTIYRRSDVDTVLNVEPPLFLVLIVLRHRMKLLSGVPVEEGDNVIELDLVFRVKPIPQAVHIAFMRSRKSLKISFRFFMHLRGLRLLTVLG